MRSKQSRSNRIDVRPIHLLFQLGCTTCPPGLCSLAQLTSLLALSRKWVLINWINPATYIYKEHNQVVTGRPDEMKTSLISSLWEIFKEEEESKITETIVAAYGNKVGNFFLYLHIFTLKKCPCSLSLETRTQTWRPTPTVVCQRRGEHQLLVLWF